MGGSVAADLVVIGAECGGERAFPGTDSAGAGARLLAAALPGALYDGAVQPDRVALVPPDAGANTMLTAVQQAAERDGRFLLVCLVGRLVADPRLRRLALVTAGSTKDNAYRRGLAWDWVVSAMVHGSHTETLLVVDTVVDREVADALARAGGPGELLDHSRVPLWGQVAPYAPGRWGRAGAVRPGGPGSFSEALARVVTEGVPGLPAALPPAELHPVIVEIMRGEHEGTQEGARGRDGVRVMAPPPRGRLLLRNPAAVRGKLAGMPVSGELLAVLGRKDSPTRPPSA